jgi:hypothetical protein
MGGAPLIIPLVGLAIPIALLICAAIFDVGVVAWALYRVWHNRVQPRIARIATRSPAAAQLLRQTPAPRLRHR